MYCGQANLELGYLIIAESMLQRSLTYPEIEMDTHRLLALVYRDQGHFSQACEMYLKVLNSNPSHECAFEVAQLFAYQNEFDRALIYFT